MLVIKVHLWEFALTRTYLRRQPLGVAVFHFPSLFILDRKKGRAGREGGQRRGKGKEGWLGGGSEEES